MCNDDKYDKPAEIYTHTHTHTRINRFGAFIVAFCLFLANFTGMAYAAISTTQYIHSKILSEKNITLPLETGANPSNISGLNYLMRQIDAANAVLGRTTNYATGFGANIVSAERALNNIRTLITIVPEFSVQLTGMTANSQFSFRMSAKGSFMVDWGDGTLEIIDKPDTTNTTYTHTYAKAGNYTVGLAGEATEYTTDAVTGVIMFNNSINSQRITGIFGDLGKVFPYGPNIKFYATFNGLRNLISIPSTLFESVQGAPTFRMFETTFMNTGITSIPNNLFAGVVGAPTVGMFSFVFAGCTELTGSIPGDLFKGIVGPLANFSFYGVFRDCRNLTGSIPGELFAGVTGKAVYAFTETFLRCTGLTGQIPSNLFAGTKNSTGMPSYMFSLTFAGCSGLTGSIPSGLFGTFTGAQSQFMFDGTFKDCTGITTIEDGIWDLSGVVNTPAPYIFQNTFAGMTSLTSASPKIAPGSNVELWEHFTNYTGQNGFAGNTNMANYNCIPTAWGGGGQTCVTTSPTACNAQTDIYNVDENTVSSCTGGSFNGSNITNFTVGGYCGPTSGKGGSSSPVLQTCTDCSPATSAAGENCYCKLHSVNGTPVSSSRFVFRAPNSNCAYYCANYCADNAENNINFRSVLFSALGS